MALRPDRPVPSEPAPDVDPNADTLADDAWPVPNLYYVEPEEPEEEVEQRVAPNGSARRRVPPRLGAKPLALLVALLLLALATAVLAASLLSGDEPTPSAEAGQVDVPSRPSRTTTNAAPSSSESVVPDVGGLQFATARAKLEVAGFRVERTFEASARPQGEVLQQSTAGRTESARGSVVTLTVSSGPDRVAVPDVEGLTARAAGRALRRAGLEVEVRVAHTEDAPGTVLAQEPPAGASVDPGDVVRLEISAGPATVTRDVPDLVGLTLSSAQRMLHRLELRSTIVRVESSEPAGVVVAQTPAAGTKLRSGGVIRLRVSSGPATGVVRDVTGLDVDSARSQLEAAGFTVVTIDEPTTDPGKDGLVVGQDPRGGTEAQQGATVTLTVARFG